MENSPGSSTSIENRLDVELRTSGSNNSTTICPGPRPGTETHRHTIFDTDWITCEEGCFGGSLSGIF